MNGKKEDLSFKDVRELILHFKLNPEQVAVERNGEILPRKSWDSTVLNEDDRIELIRFVGGG